MKLKKQIIETGNFLKTKKLGCFLAEKILKNGVLDKKGLVVSLSGDLGSGKTTFIQGFCLGLKIKKNITSPTFVIMKEYPFETEGLFYHLDCYRLKDEQDLIDLGFLDMIKKKKTIVAIEWPEIVKHIIPQDSLFLEFKYLDKNKRQIVLKNKRHEEISLN